MKLQALIMRSNHQAERRWFLLSSAAWLASGITVALADDPRLLRRGAHRVKPLCSLPPADYQHGARSPSVIMRSQLAIPLIQPELVTQAVAAIRDSVPPVTNGPATVPRVPCVDNPQADCYEVLNEIARRQAISQVLVTNATKPQGKLILLPQRELAVMHCEISDVALLIEANGLWHLSLRADQNPTSRRNDQERNLELQMKRNAFRINLRLLHSSRPGGEALSATTDPQNRFDQAGKLAVTHIAVDEFWVEREAPGYIRRDGIDAKLAQYFDFVDQAEIEFFVRLDPLTGNGRGVIQPWQREP